MDFDDLTKDANPFEEIGILLTMIAVMTVLLAWRIICLPVTLIRSGKTRSQPRHSSGQSQQN